MKKNFKQILRNKLTELETNDSFLGFMGDELNFDAGEVISGGCAPKALASPYIINIANSTAGVLTATLFGYNLNQATANFGSPAGITITTDTTYLQMLSQSNSNPFSFQQLRVIGSGTGQFAQSIAVNYTNANNNFARNSYNLSIYRDNYQQLTDQIDVTLPDVIAVDGNVYLTLPIVANSSCTLVFFPVGIASQSHILTSGQSSQHFSNPVLSPLVQNGQAIFAKPRMITAGQGKG